MSALAFFTQLPICLKVPLVLGSLWTLHTLTKTKPAHLIADDIIQELELEKRTHEKAIAHLNRQLGDTP